MRILVTGARGHVAQTVIPRLEVAGHGVLGLDLPEDVCQLRDVRRYAHADFCIHLAGMKYADRAELEPIRATDVNVRGTWNVCEVFGPHVVLASTCKAADPETVYGSSKLIAERIALEAGGRVVRLVNVLGSAGSVVDIWKALPPGQSIPVCDATRLFMSVDHAAELFVRALDWPTGRYGPARVYSRHMDDVAAQLYPDRPIERIPLRRGDRRHERLFADCETVMMHTDPLAVCIESPHDPAVHVETRAVA